MKPRKPSSKVKITIEDSYGNKQEFNNVAQYRHVESGMELITEDGSVKHVPKEEIKHSYVGSPIDENRIRSLNS